LTDLVFSVVRQARFEDAARERIPERKSGKYKGPCARADRPLVTWLDPDQQRRESHELVRRSLAFVLAICEQLTLYGKNAGKACHSGLWLGKQRRKVGGQWQYVPGPEQEGLAARMGCDVRTLERTIAVLEGGRVIKAWQPPAADVPAHLRGETYAYQVYTLVSGVPDCLAASLRRWDEVERQRAGKGKRRKTVAPALDASGDALAAAVADAVADAAMSDEALAAMAFVRGMNKPPAPS
jgi:hypothetical protein